MLHDQGRSLQGNRKTEEGADHPDRDAQFRFITSRVKRALAAKTPVISVDTKWYPYGAYDLGRNSGFVNVGTDHDTGVLAVASIRGWWRFEGKRLYRKAQELVITADGGGSNGHRVSVSEPDEPAAARDLSVHALGTSLVSNIPAAGDAGIEAVRDAQRGISRARYPHPGRFARERTRGAAPGAAEKDVLLIHRPRCAERTGRADQHLQRVGGRGVRLETADGLHSESKYRSAE